MSCRFEKTRTLETETEKKDTTLLWMGLCHHHRQKQLNNDSLSNCPQFAGLHVPFAMTAIIKISNIYFKYVVCLYAYHIPIR